MNFRYRTNWVFLCCLAAGCAARQGPPPAAPAIATTQPAALTGRQAALKVAAEEFLRPFQKGPAESGIDQYVFSDTPDARAALSDWKGRLPMRFGPENVRGKGNPRGEPSQYFQFSVVMESADRAVVSIRCTDGVAGTHATYKMTRSQGVWTISDHQEDQGLS